MCTALLQLLQKQGAHLGNNRDFFVKWVPDPEHHLHPPDACRLSCVHLVQNRLQLRRPAMPRAQEVNAPAPLLAHVMGPPKERPVCWADAWL